MYSILYFIYLHSNQSKMVGRPTGYIQGVTGGMDQTSAGCSLGHTIPI